MRYHFVMDGYAPDLAQKMQEMNGFKKAYLKGAEEGESYIYCRQADDITGMKEFLTESAVLLIGEDIYSPEVVLKLLDGLLEKEDLYIFGSGFSGTELCVRAAKRAGGSSVTAVHEADFRERAVVKKMVYSNHMEGSFLMKKGPYCVSMAKGIDREPLSFSSVHILKTCNYNNNIESSLSKEVVIEQTGSDLADAKLVIAAGRGVKSAENVKELEKIADRLGAWLGVSRPAAMNAWAPMQKLIGVSGAMISPQICITAGVSGAAAFYAGIEKSSFIVAVNSDDKAPINKKADVVIVDDYRPVLCALEERINKGKAGE